MSLLGDGGYPFLNVMWSVFIILAVVIRVGP